MLDNLGLISTLQWYCREFQALHPEYRIELKTLLEEKIIPEELKVVLFRIAQEALNNVAKHSKAEWVTVSLSSDGGGISLIISDDGQGMDFNSVNQSSTSWSLGLISMRERAELTGGKFSIESAPGQGTTVRVFWQISQLN